MADRDSLAIHPARAAALAFGPFRYDVAERTLWRGPTEVALAPRALALLARLLEQPGRLVPKDALVAAVWPGTFVGDAALAEAVSLLREGLGDDAQRPTYVQTVHRRGYRFVAPVTVEHVAGPVSAPPPFGALTDASAGRRRRTLTVAAVGLALVATLAVGLLAYRAGRRQVATPPLRRATLLLPADLRLDVPVAPALALSPAGDLLVYGARRGDELQLWVRRLDRWAGEPVAGTSGAAVPFVSPDGAWIGFFSDGRLLKVAATGGEPVTLARSPYPFGASWGEDGTILYAPDSASGLWRVAAGGGEPVPVTRPDAAAGEVGHRWPQVLPGGRAALFTAWRGSVARSSLELVDLRSRARRRLLAGASFPRFAAGFLVCVRGDGLAAAPFDLRRLRLAGAPAAVLDGVAIDPARGSAQLALAADGTLVYLPGGSERRVLLRVSDEGVAALPLPPARYRNVAASADGRRLALTTAEDAGSALWVADVAHGALTRLTGPGRAIEPVWSADGRTIFFAAVQDGVLRLMRVPSDGSAPAEPLLPPAAGAVDRFPAGVTSDAKALLFVENGKTNGADLWLLPLAGDAPAGPPRPLERTPAMERSAAVSPDGRWLAWSSDESGRVEVYLRPLAGGSRLRLSSQGGAQPHWSPDGRLWYRQGKRLLTVDVAAAQGTPRPSPPRLLYEDPDLDRYAALPGGAVVIARDPQTAEPPRLELVLGWPGELARLAGR